MFQGIINQQGQILERGKNSLAVTAQNPWRARRGQSVCVNGVCLTATRESSTLYFDLGEETLKNTNLGHLTKESFVNIEKPMRITTPIDGHVVLGHVDYMGYILERHDVGNSIVFVIGAPGFFEKYIVRKGSIAIEGVSLTIHDVVHKKGVLYFDVCVVPETKRLTNFGIKKIGDRVNLEIDYIAKLVVHNMDKRHLRKDLIAQLPKLDTPFRPLPYNLKPLILQGTEELLYGKNAN